MLSSAKNGVLQSNKSFFVEKFDKILLRRSPKFIFIAFLSRNFSKIFVNRAPLERGNPNVGAFAPKSKSNPLVEKIGRQHPESAELVVRMIPSGGLDRL